MQFGYFSLHEKHEEKEWNGTEIVENILNVECFSATDWKSSKN